MLLTLVFAISPMPIKRFIGKYILHWSIDPSANIGISYISTQRLVMEPNTRIGHFNVIRDMKEVHLEAGSHMAQWNWLSSAKELSTDNSQFDAGKLFLGAKSAIMSRHYLDCSGGIVVGRSTIIGGVKSTFLTHQIDMSSGVQTIAPIIIGDNCFLGSDIRVVAGTTIPSKSLIAMGAVVTGMLPTESTLYAGVPARPVRAADGKWFQRSITQ